MPVKLAVPETNMITLKPRISVVGVGGGGGNAVNNMITKTLEGVDFIVANTDAQALANSKCTRRIQLGVETTRGLGAGACPEVGKAAAEEARAEIEKELEGANMVFITAGMGGGTGSGAAPVIAKIAKEKGILTIGVITKPFQFEGKKRAQIAEKAVEEFISSVDSIIIIPNQNLFRIADKNTTLADAFVMADNVLYSGVRSITDLMTMPGLINLDFADVKNIMSDKGKSIMGTGEAEGDNRAIKAAEEALSNPLLDYNNMSGAKGVLINITGGPDITLFEVDEAANRIKEEVDEEANIIFGSSFDESLTGKIRVSIVATGIGEAKNAQTKTAPITNYLEESYNSGSSIPNIPSDEIDSNLAKFAATIVPESIEEEPKEVVEEPTYEEPSPIEDIIPEEEIKVANEPIAIIDDLLNEEEANDNGFSSVMNDMPQASSLFNAVMNRTERNDVDAQLESALSSQGNIFSPSNSPRLMEEEEPELFATPQIFATPTRQERNEELIVPEDKEYKPTFLDRVTGRSILLNRNKKKAEKEQQHYQEPVTPSLASGGDYAENDLSIPSFLRRK